MAVAFASSSTGTNSGDSALVITKPTGLAAGDVLVAFCLRAFDGSGFSTPSGWTLLQSQADGTAYSVSVFAKVADSTDAAASNFSFSVASATGDGTAGALCRITGESFTSVAANIASVDGTATGTSSLSYTGLTPVGPNSLLVMFVSNQDSNFDVTYSAYAVANSNPTWTEAYDVATVENMDYAIAYGTFAPTTTTGNFSATASQSGDHIGCLVSIIETASVTVEPSVINMTVGIQAPSVAADAVVSVGAVSLTSNAPAPTLTLGAAKWSNTDKSAAPTWTNTNKS